MIMIIIRMLQSLQSLDYTYQFFPTLILFLLRLPVVDVVAKSSVQRFGLDLGQSSGFEIKYNPCAFMAMCMSPILCRCQCLSLYLCLGLCSSLIVCVYICVYIFVYPYVCLIYMIAGLFYSPHTPSR